MPQTLGLGFQGEDVKLLQRTLNQRPLTGLPPTFLTFGEVTNVGQSTAHGTNQTLTVGDRYVTVTAPGKTMTLPATPLDGQTHAIKSQPGITVDVDTADRRAIDGQLTIPLAGGESATFRYSAATGEWERRC